MTTAPPTVLLTGATGYLGAYLTAEIHRRDLRLCTAGRKTGDVTLDLSQPATVRAALESVRPDLVLNCGALASLGTCEAQPDLAQAINADAAGVLGEASPRMLQISTDLVFDGTKAPYRADARPEPLHVYGQTKAVAEGSVVAAGGLVVRLPLLFAPSADGRRGATDMIRSATPGQLTLFTNEYRTPVHAADAARALVDLLLDRDRVGVVHVAGPERVSRFDLGVRFAKIAGLSPELFQPGECRDPARPEDVSLCGDWVPERSLDEALADC